jgi:hypothetical protein
MLHALPFPSLHLDSVQTTHLNSVQFNSVQHLSLAVPAVAQLVPARRLRPGAGPVRVVRHEVQRDEHQQVHGSEVEHHGRATSLGRHDCTCKGGEVE